MTSHRRRKFGDAKKSRLLCELTRVSYKTFLHSDYWKKTICKSALFFKQVAEIVTRFHQYKLVTVAFEWSWKYIFRGGWCHHPPFRGRVMASSTHKKGIFQMRVMAYHPFLQFDVKVNTKEWHTSQSQKWLCSVAEWKVHTRHKVSDSNTG